MDLLVELTRISSPSGDVEGLRAYAQRLSTEFSARGLGCEIRTQKDPQGRELPVFVARGPAVGPRFLLLISHLDTVLAAGEARLSEERLWATGANDTKGGVAALLGALDLLRERGQRPPADFCFVAVPDEEVGGEISRQTVREFGAAARALWVLEPGASRTGGVETLVVGRRGLFHWRLGVRGRAAHSGLHYWLGLSALATASRFTMRALELSSRGPGPTVNPARLVAGDATFVEELGKNHDLLGSERQINVVPDRAVLEGEARYLSPNEGRVLEESLGDLARHLALADEVAVSWWTGNHVHPVDPKGPHGALSSRALELAAAAGWTLELEEDRGGISFPNFLEPGAQIPVLDGLGPVGGGMHTREEWVSLASLDRRTRLLADLLAADAGEPAPS